MTNATINAGIAVGIKCDHCPAGRKDTETGERREAESDEWDWVQDVECTVCGATGAFRFSSSDGVFDSPEFEIDAPFLANGSREGEL